MAMKVINTTIENKRKNAEAYIKLQIKALKQPYRKLCEVVIKDKDFLKGFGAKSHHHNYEGGLVIHTAEVLKNCLSVNYPALQIHILIVASIWHDYMKKKDYQLDTTDKIQYTTYKERIYHISGSFGEFYHHAKLVGLDEKEMEEIGHCLLSHHGRLEWGSPITPKTPEATVLHWADCMSAWFENGAYKEKTF